MSHSSLLADWLALYFSPGIGVHRFHQLLQHCGSFSGIVRSDPEQLVSQGMTSMVTNALDQLQKQSHDKQISLQVEQSLEWADEATHHILTLEDPAYPELLKQIHHPPPILFVKGKLESLQRWGLAVVGSRRPSADGRQLSKQFSRALSQTGLTIVSGLALGVDTCAHQSAVDAKGLTLAVMGTGMDQIYPARNTELALKICEQGALISEFPLGTKPMAANFPRRNRIIAGLSRGTLVIEAGLKSGSLITARYALEQNREVFAIPGSIHNPTCRGCHALIKQGAKLVEEVRDVVEELNIDQLGFGWDAAEHSRKMADNDAHRVQLCKEDQQVLELMGYGVITVDQICERGFDDIAALSRSLSKMELLGVVQAVSGGYQRLS